MTTLYTAYDPATGLITDSGEISDETLEAYVNMGLHVLLDVRLSSDTHYVADHEPVPYTEAELAVKNALAPGWIWKMPERAPLDMRGLAEAKMYARIRVNLARDRAEHAPFTCNGYLYDGDEKATARITGAVSLAMMAAMAGQPFTKDWTLADNTVITLDGPAMLAVGAALGTKVGAVFDTARDLQERIEAATTAAQADAITWPE